LPVSAPKFLAAARELPVLPPEALPELAPALVLAPHPDDESLACGGLIAALATQGLPVRVVALSDGSASHPGSRRFPPMRLRGRREVELLAAVGELGLGPAAVRFLRLPDSRVPRRGEPGFADALDADQRRARF
jgi:LmbE family N-acetylglucosaminyl deacetylase